jgi:hypothetical protein
MPLAEATLNSLLNAYFNNTSYANANVWLKLHTGDPGTAGANNAAGETTRQEVTFPAAAVAATSNDNTVTWTSVSTAETYSWLSLWTAAAAGTFTGRVQLVASKAVNIGDTFTIPIGDFDANAS